MVYRLVHGVQAGVQAGVWCVYRYRCMVYWLVYGV